MRWFICSYSISLLSVNSQYVLFFTLLGFITHHPFCCYRITLQLGHSWAARGENVRVNGFGVFVIGVYPGAFTEMDDVSLSKFRFLFIMRNQEIIFYGWIVPEKRNHHRECIFLGSPPSRSPFLLNGCFLSERCLTWSRLRIYTGGIWHNLVLALLGYLLVINTPSLMTPLFVEGQGVTVDGLFSCFIYMRIAFMRVFRFRRLISSMICEFCIRVA